MKNKNEHKSLGHPLATGSLSNNIRLLWKNRGISGKYIFRALNIFTSNLFLSPLRLLEIIRWADKVDKTQIQEPPIFIIGTWRSGTTYLHNLLSHDSNFGFVSTLQAFCPNNCIEGLKILYPIFKKLLPIKRPMDNMIMSLDYPQEEEFALGNLSPHSFYHGYYLPKRMPSLFRLLSFKENNEELKNEWKLVYLTLLKKATLIMGGKRLVLKNPLNTYRIPVLLEMFPKAKFIYLYRNPYLIYYSLLHTFTRLTGAYQLEKISKAAIEENVFNFYEELVRTYWDTKYLIPSGNLVEVRFEDFEDRPMEIIEKIYSDLNLPINKNTEDKIQQHILSQDSYIKNKYTANRETINRISQRWRFAIEEQEYALPKEFLET